MNKINDINGLRAEITRLKEQSKQQEQLIRKDLVQIKEDLKPGNLLMNMVSSATGVKMERNELLKNGLAIGLTVFLRRIMLRTESKVEEKVYEYVDRFSDKLKSIISSFGNKEKKDDKDSYESNTGRF
jgi:hypothetical protein